MSAHPYPEYGPMSMRTFAENASAVLRDVREENRTVLITVRGELAAVIKPVTPEMVYSATPTPDVVSSRFMARDNPSAVVKAVRSGETRVLTFHNRPFASMVPPGEWAGYDELFNEGPVRESTVDLSSDEMEAIAEMRRETEA